jgi:tRNA-dihydrouridine synthase
MVPGTLSAKKVPGTIFYTEMISAAGLLSGGQFEKYYLDGGPCPERLVYQLLGADAGRLAQAAARLDALPCLGVDLNMGCAAPAITRTGGGVRLMGDIDKAGEIVRACRRVMKKRLSVKIRLGTKNFQPHIERFVVNNLPGFDYLLAFCKRLADEGADFIALHPRWGDEKFKRRARWEYVEALRKELPAACGRDIPVAGNGDIKSRAELERRLASGPAMLGRLAVKEPWIFSDASNLTSNHANPTNENFVSEVRKVREVSGSFLHGIAERFLELLARYQPPEFHLSRARRFFHYYCDNFKWAEYLRNKINREETLAGIGRVVGEYCRGQDS